MLKNGDDMKLFILISLALLSFNYLNAQDTLNIKKHNDKLKDQQIIKKNDSESSVENEKQPKKLDLTKQLQKSKFRGFIDTDGNGIDDRLESQLTKRVRYQKGKQLNMQEGNSKNLQQHKRKGKNNAHNK